MGVQRTERNQGLLQAVCLEQLLGGRPFTDLWNRRKRAVGLIRKKMMSSVLDELSLRNS